MCSPGPERGITVAGLRGSGRFCTITRLHSLLSHVHLLLRIVQKIFNSLPKRGGSERWRLKWLLKVVSGILQRNVVNHLEDLQKMMAQLRVCVQSAHMANVMRLGETLHETLSKAVERDIAEMSVGSSSQV